MCLNFSCSTIFTLLLLKEVSDFELISFQTELKTGVLMDSVKVTHSSEELFRIASFYNSLSRYYGH
jgi:hypothetical protein